MEETSSDVSCEGRHWLCFHGVHLGTYGCQAGLVGAVSRRKIKNETLSSHNIVGNFMVKLEVLAIQIPAIPRSTLSPLDSARNHQEFYDRNVL